MQQRTQPVNRNQNPRIHVSTPNDRIGRGEHQETKQKVISKPGLLVQKTPSLSKLYITIIRFFFFEEIAPDMQED